MDTPAPRLPSRLHALIAEAKRRARQRRLLLLLVGVAIGVTVALVFRPSNGTPSASARLGGVAANTAHRVQFGAFAITVPKSIQYWVGGTGSQLSGLQAVALTDHHLQAVVTASALYRTDVYLSVRNDGTYIPLAKAQLPLDLQELSPVANAYGKEWNGFISGGGEVFSIMLFEGSKSSPASRAAIERALASIRRAG